MCECVYWLMIFVESYLQYCAASVCVHNLSAGAFIKSHEGSIMMCLSSLSRYNDWTKTSKKERHTHADTHTKEETQRDGERKKLSCRLKIIKTMPGTVSWWCVFDSSLEIYFFSFEIKKLTQNHKWLPTRWTQLFSWDLLNIRNEPNRIDQPGARKRENYITIKTKTKTRKKMIVCKYQNVK